jgi:hypothetical protein
MSRTPTSAAYGAARASDGLPPEQQPWLSISVQVVKEQLAVSEEKYHLLHATDGAGMCESHRIELLGPRDRLVQRKASLGPIDDCDFCLLFSRSSANGV